jgi:D-tyrosyl-tRNA(Tyr) deacylase
MRAVVQRVLDSKVYVNNKQMSSIQQGLLVYLGVAQGDESHDAEYMAGKILDMRIFTDEAGKMNLNVLDIKGAILLISSFTLCGDCRKGRRPSFDNACDPQQARILYEMVAACIEQKGIHVQTGQFGAYMNVSCSNNGPVTFLLDSCRQF